MSELIQLTYTSIATQPIDTDSLLTLLKSARRKNKQLGITGMLLYADDSFFQVLEGDPGTIDQLFQEISQDKRHSNVTIIIREPIDTRTFGDWTMGHAQFTMQDAEEILGANDVFGRGESFAQLQPGRAKKLLEAFTRGRWRAMLSDVEPLTANAVPPLRPTSSGILHQHPAPERQSYTFAFQPIVDIDKGEIFSYEALIRGLGQEPASQVLSKIPPSQLHKFDEESRILALRLAAHLGLSARLNLNFLPRSHETSPHVITSLLKTAESLGIRPGQLVIEILERELISDFTTFNKFVNECRAAGVIFAIDDFGSGYAGLNLLAEFQPNLIKLDMQLIRDIQRSGPRQAIVRGIMRTCLDLGIDIIAEGVESIEEFQWLRREGISLYQGNLLFMPAFEALPSDLNLPFTHSS